MAVRVTLALVLAAPTRLAAPSTVARPGVVPAARARERALARATVGDVDPFEATPSAAPRERRNKYAQFSRADDEYGARLERGELGGPVERKSRVRRRPITLRRAPSEPRERGVITYPDAAAVDPTDPTTFGFCEIGRVVGAHGVRGDVKVQSDTDFATERLCTPGVRYLKVPTRRAPREVVVTSGVLARTLKEGLGAIYIVRIEGVEDRDDADALRGCTLFTRDGPAPASLARDRDEYLVREVVGCAVFLMPDGAQFVGTVVGMVCADEITGNAALGNDLLDVEKARPPDGGRAERIFVPFVKALCPHVDLPARRIMIEPIPGLLELTQPPEEEAVFVRGLLPASGQSGEGRERPSHAS